MAIKTLYLTHDGEFFDNEVEAKEHEKELEQLEKVKHYHVVVTIKQDYYVDAFNEQKAADIVIDGWTSGSLKPADEAFYGIETYEED